MKKRETTILLSCALLIFSGGGIYASWLYNNTKAEEVNKDLDSSLEIDSSISEGEIKVTANTLSIKYNDIDGDHIANDLEKELIISGALEIEFTVNHELGEKHELVTTSPQLNLTLEAPNLNPLSNGGSFNIGLTGFKTISSSSNKGDGTQSSPKIWVYTISNETFKGFFSSIDIKAPTKVAYDEIRDALKTAKYKLNIKDAKA